jgi:hypothetical protein
MRRALASCLLLSACTVGGDPPDAGPRDGSRADAPTHDGFTPGDANVPRDSGPDAWIDRCSEACGDQEICDAMGDGNGLDDDCDGLVDEICVCMPGTARACFPGRPDRRGVGACADGIMICSEFAFYGPCTGGQFPADEVCDGADNDCDGAVDDDLAECASELSCPDAERASPLRAHALEGSRIYGGEARSWSWSVSCPPTVATCPEPDDPSARDTSIFLISSGNYRARLEVELEDGTTSACEWIIYVRGDGLRVELNWDTQGVGRGDTDVDLHLHRRSIPEGEVEGETDFFGAADDCYYLTCKASTYGYMENMLRPRWGLPDTTELAACSGAPHGEGGLWETVHEACYNPRLDVDVISCDPEVTDARSMSFCAPENINIDDPPIGEPYRVWVNYYSSHEYLGDTHPSVNIYCYGELRGAFGLDPTLITLRNGAEATDRRTHDNWHVADVIFFIDECGRPECLVEPLGEVVNNARFGRPWSF